MYSKIKTYDTQLYRTLLGNRNYSCFVLCIIIMTITGFSLYVKKTRIMTLYEYKKNEQKENL